MVKVVSYPFVASESVGLLSFVSGCGGFAAGCVVGPPSSVKSSPAVHQLASPPVDLTSLLLPAMFPSSRGGGESAGGAGSPEGTATKAAGCTVGRRAAPAALRLPPPHDASARHFIDSPVLPDASVAVPVTPRWWGGLSMVRSRPGFVTVPLGSPSLLARSHRPNSASPLLRRWSRPPLCRHQRSLCLAV